MNIPAPDYDSTTRPPPMVEEFIELLKYRGLLRLMIVNDIRARYKRSALGVLWTLINPLLTMAVMTIAFSTLFHSQLKNYPVYLLTGLIFWNFFSQSTNAAMTQLVWGGRLLKRIYLPRTIFAVSAVGSGLVNLLINLIPLALIMLVMGQPLSWSLLLLPLAILLVAMFTLGISLGISILAVLFTDVIDTYDVLLKIVFYLTAIMYPASIVPPHYSWLLYINPIYYLLQVFRQPIYDGVMPDLMSFAIAALSAIVALVAGWWLFTQKADELTYRI